MKINRPILFHYSPYKALWERGNNLIQCGPFIEKQTKGLSLGEVKTIKRVNGEYFVNTKQEALDLRKYFLENVSIKNLIKVLELNNISTESILLHYIDPFLLKGPIPLSNLDLWKGPKILICGDLHHGTEDSIRMVKEYLDREFHDSIVIAFNPSLSSKLKSEIGVPIHISPPGFFRYPFLEYSSISSNSVVHIGNINKYHIKRKRIIDRLISNPSIKFEHLKTRSSEEAAYIYNKTGLSLNIPLNNDLNHRFFEIISAGGRQIILGEPNEILGPLVGLKNTPGVYWASNENELITIAMDLLSKWQNNEPKVPTNLKLRKQLLEPSIDNLIKKWLGINSYIREY